jgi:phosphoenolpyruvate synthase/pyruvate phosphate dikinase
MRKLTDSQVKMIAEEVSKIESHYELPQDIEWAIDKQGKLHILQSRPITTLTDQSSSRRDTSCSGRRR